MNIVQHVQDLLKENEEKICLNVFGFSRGGVAALLLAQKLKTIPRDRLTINIAALEPVPGNFTTTVDYDLTFKKNKTISSAIYDLSDCNNVDRILLLYINEPMPDVVGHAPILPILPETCRSEIDVTPGCHKGAATFYSLRSYRFKIIDKYGRSYLWV